MKVLYTGFDGVNNPSNVILKEINNNKIIFKNTYKEITKILLNKEIEQYDLIVMLGLRTNLKKSIRIEEKAYLDNELIETRVDCIKLKEYFIKNDTSCIINNKPTNYLCNYAYYKVFKKIKILYLFIFLNLKISKN